MAYVIIFEQILKVHFNLKTNQSVKTHMLLEHFFLIGFNVAFVNRVSFSGFSVKKKFQSCLFTALWKLYKNVASTTVNPD